MYKKVLSYVLVVALMFSSLQIGTLMVSAAEIGVIEKEENSNTQGKEGLVEEIEGEENVEGENLEIVDPSEETLEIGNPKVEIAEEQVEDETVEKESEGNNVLEAEKEEAEERDGRLEESLDELARKYQDELPDGTYYIRTILTEKKVLDVAKGSLSNKANAVIKTFEKSDSQRWKVTHDKKGYITFINEKSGKALDVSNGGKNADKTVWQYASNGTLAQKWIARKDGNNYEIISAVNGMVLDVKNANFSDNTGIQIYHPNNTEAQRFQMISINPKVEQSNVKIQEGIYRLIPKNQQGYAVDICESSFMDKSNVQISPVNDAISQLFQVEYREGYYSFINQYSCKALDVELGGFMPTTNVWQYTYNSSKAQKWKAIKNEDGTYSFVSVQNGMTLGVDEMNVQVNNPEEIENNSFILEKVNDSALDRLAWENKEVLLDGTYYIRTMLKSTSVVQIQNQSISNREHAVIHRFEQDISQQWEVSHDTKGYITFTNKKSGKVLDVSNGGRNVEKTVWQFTSNDSLAQKWIVQKEGMKYKIISALNGMVLDVRGGNHVDNTRLQIYASKNVPAQQFDLIPTKAVVEKCEEVIPSGYYYICAKENNGYALDIQGGMEENGANLQIYKLNHSFAQAFDIQYKDGYYTIRNMYSNKLLDVASGGLMPTTNVWQYADNGTDAQKWSVVENSDGSYTFISVQNGLVLDIADGKVASGSNVWVYTNNGSDAQKFVLKKAESFYPGWYNIASAMDNEYVLEISGGHIENGTSLQLYKNNKTEAQKWNAIRNSDGTFRFENSKSKKVIDIANGNVQQDNMVWIWPNNETSAQKWIVEKLKDNTWRIVSVANRNYVLALEGSVPRNKTKIVIQKWANQESQKWILKKATPVKRKYQNPSQYYQIKDSITLKGGGYNLSYGYEGVKVMKVIQKLGLGNGIGMNGAFYSKKVENAVKKFQKKQGLRQTGVVDLTTWQEMGYTKTQWEQWGAYVSPLKVSIDSTRSEHIEAMIATAYSYLGTPYVIGASGPPGTGIDCSGLVMQALYSAGIDTSPINPVRHAKPGYEYESRNMWKSSQFKHVPYSQRQRGDLIFYQNSSGVVIHVAIYLGNNKVIESWPNKVVVWPIKNGSRSNIKGVVRPFV